MRQRKSEAVLESARTLFLSNGYDATTVDDIAERAHVSKATVYSNFPDKAAVLSALLEWGAEQGATTLWLHVETGNDPAIALYETLGLAEPHACRYLVSPGR